MNLFASIFGCFFGDFRILDGILKRRGWRDYIEIGGSEWSRCVRGDGRGEHKVVTKELAAFGKRLLMGINNRTVTEMDSVQAQARA